MFELNSSYRELREEARALADAVAPFAAEADALSEIHPEVRRLIAASGLLKLHVPSEFGGRHQQPDPLAITVVREVLMATSAQADSLFALQGVGSYPVTRGGSRELCERWLPRVAAGEVLAALALTEPEAGSDLKGIKTTLTVEQGGLVLNGAKSFISNAGAADFYSVFAREDDGYSMVLVPADAAGLSCTPSPELTAPHVLGELVFEGVRVEPEARLGEAGAGFDLVLSTLAVFRASVAGAAIGLAEAALEEAARHAARRQQFGKPMVRLGGVAEQLADSKTELEAARLLCYRAAALAAEAPMDALNWSSMAKLFATETAGRVVDRSVQVMGRWGLIHGSKIDRLYRQARPMRIYEGASEVLKLGIAASLAKELGEPADGGDH